MRLSISTIPALVVLESLMTPPRANSTCAPLPEPQSKPAILTAPEFKTTANVTSMRPMMREKLQTITCRREGAGMVRRPHGHMGGGDEVSVSWGTHHLRKCDALKEAGAFRGLEDRVRAHVRV